MTRPVRLCFVAPLAYALFNPRVQDTFGGAEVQLYLLATALARDPCFDVHFVTGDYGQAAVESREGVRVHRGIPVRVESLPTRAMRWGPRLVGLIRRIGADVLVQRTAGAHTGLMRLVTKLFGQKMVYMVAHQIDCNGDFERENGMVQGQLYRYGIRRADVVIAQSEEQWLLLRQHHRRESLVMPSMHRIPEESEVLSAPRDSVLWVGRCEQWKRPEVVLELAGRFPEERFVMVAPAALGQRDRYQDVRRQALALRNVEHVEFVPFPEIDGYFRRAKLFLQTSIHEGFPNTFVQAAMNATPIASLQVNPDDFLGRYDCGACAEGSVERLAEIVRRMLRDRALRERQAKSAWQYARAHHEVGSIAGRYGKLFREVAARGRSDDPRSGQRGGAGREAPGGR